MGEFLTEYGNLEGKNSLIKNIKLCRDSTLKKYRESFASSDLSPEIYKTNLYNFRKEITAIVE
jgi:hypothetical protein